MLKLSEIIHLLGKILGIVIKVQEGSNYLNKVENIRVLSKFSRKKTNFKNTEKIYSKLKSRISSLKPQESLIVARSFSQFLNFANLAESLYSVYKIHDNNIRKTQGTNEFIILEDAIKKLLRDKRISKNKFYQTASNLKIDLVLTAHPTEVKRRTVIQKYANINDIIEKFNSENKINPDSLEENLYKEITSIWKTDEIKRIRPTPIEEAKWGLAIIEDSLWNAIPKICRKFDKIIHA